VGAVADIDDTRREHRAGVEQVAHIGLEVPIETMAE
jgi:hypothetical protein